MTDHYTLIPEWAPQSAVMLTWPNSNSPWVPSIDAANKNFLDIAAAVLPLQKLIISCKDQSHLQSIQQLFKENDLWSDTQIRWYIVPSNDSWSRDFGPLSVRSPSGQLRLLNFRFNAWGNKYDGSLDDQVSRSLHTQGAFGQTPFERVDTLVLEGGSIETDGHGGLLTTRRCLLSKNRNPQLLNAQIEDQLRHYLGVEHILWLDNGFLEGDDTDGHVDTLARFTDSNTIAYVSCADPEDPLFTGLTRMAQEVHSLRNFKGKAYRTCALPLPKPIRNKEGDRLPATYANFLIINGGVLVPTYNDPADADAIAILEDCFPDRVILPVDCRTLIEQFGSLHCVTMQIAAGIE